MLPLFADSDLAPRYARQMAAARPVATWCFCLVGPLTVLSSFISVCKNVLAYHWKLCSDGWIQFPHQDHGIVWIPTQFRNTVVADETHLVISVQGYSKISLLDCVHGRDWFECWSHE